MCDPLLREQILLLRKFSSTFVFPAKRPPSSEQHVVKLWLKAKCDFGFWPHGSDLNTVWCLPESFGFFIWILASFSTSFSSSTLLLHPVLLLPVLCSEYVRKQCLAIFSWMKKNVLAHSLRMRFVWLKWVSLPPNVQYVHETELNYSSWPHSAWSQISGICNRRWYWCTEWDVAAARWDEICRTQTVTVVLTDRAGCQMLSNQAVTARDVNHSDL